jgi:hypothetical protein
MRHLRLLSLALLLGCPNKHLPVEIVKFEVGAPMIRAGETVTIRWETTNAATVEIIATPPGTPLPGVAGNSGTVTTAALFAPTTFQLIATGEDGLRVNSEAVRVNVVGISVQSFTATPNTIDPGQTSTLEWAIGGDAPTEVVLTDEAGTELYSDSSPTGSFDVTPNITTTYTLTVTAESGTDEEMVTVMVSDIPPQIVSFTAVPDPVAIGMLTTLSWETAGAYEVQVLKGDTVRRPWNTSGAARGSVSLDVDAPSVEFTLQARTATNMMTEMTIVVTGLEVPIIDQFALTPAEYTQASTTAMVVWSTTNTDRTFLHLNGQPVAGFPGIAAGTFAFTVSGGTARVELIAMNDVGEATVSGMVLSGFNEPEPNDTATTAIALAGDGVSVRGTIDPGDADVYSVMVPAGARIHALLSGDNETCSFDTLLELYASNGTTRLGFVDDTLFPPITPCSRINPAAQAWADDLAAGTYYLRVRSSTTAAATGPYSISVEVSGPEIALPGVTTVAAGSPSWRIADVIEISILIGNPNSTPPFRFLDQTFIDLALPLYTLEEFIGDPGMIHPSFRPHDPNARDYDGVLSALAAIAGYESKTTFTRAEFESDNAILLLFVLEPGPNSPIDSSYDFASGPTLQTELFPMNVEYTFAQGGNVLYPPAPGAPFQLPGYHQYMPPVAGSGSSHRIFGVVIFEGLLNGVDSVGTFTSTFVISDASGNGWTVSVPLTVTP